MSAIRLADRGVLAIEGEDAAVFLQGLVTNDVDGIAAGSARYAALLSAQGKILCDFLIARPSPAARFLIDAPRERIPMLTARLSLYKLRARVAIDDLSAGVGVFWTGDEPAPAGPSWFEDPRASGAGRRAYAPPADVDARGDPQIYEARRIALSIPKGGADFAFEDAFPHEANMDRLNGVSFQKGCYVGQEVVSRMQHRGLARNRVRQVHFAGRAPAPGSDVRAGGLLIGRMGSSAQGVGLAMLRLDRLEEAQASGARLVSDGVELTG